jgi:hypothetical protein
MPSRLESALQATGVRFAHFGWSRAPENAYGVWAEEDRRDLLANGKHIEHGLVCTVDLFTRDDSAAPRITIETALASTGYPWRLDSVSFEPETGWIHALWRVSVYGEH